MDESEQWEVISSITIWHIWVGRCKRSFEQDDTLSTVTIQNIWVNMVHKVKC